MTAAQITTLIRNRTKTTATTYPDATLLSDINLMKDGLASKIQQVRPEIWNIPGTANLVADQREYAFPEDVLNHIISLELKFDSSSDYVIARPISRKHYNDVLQESVIVDNFDNLNPKYFIRRKAIYILSGTIIDVTDGFKLVFDAFPADLPSLTGTDDLSVDPSTTTHGFPREFHELLARRVSMEYKDRNGIKFSQKEKEYQQDLESALEDFEIANLDAQIIGSLPSGATRGDNGYNY